MRARTVVVIGLAAAAVTVAVARRRRTAPPGPAVQLGLDDGSVRRLLHDDPAVAPLRRLAADLRTALERAG